MNVVGACGFLYAGLGMNNIANQNSYACLYILSHLLHEHCLIYTF